MPPQEEDGLVEAKALAKLLAQDRDWVDVEELEDEELFTRLVALLSDPGRVHDDAFALAARDASKFLRAGTLAAISNGRKPPSEWADRAKKRFARADYGERQLLLQALAVVPTRSMLAVLEAAQEDWSGSPLATDVSKFLDARVAQGERLTTAELAKLGVGLQPLVAELLEGATSATRTALTPALDQWRQQSIDTSFFRELGRLVDLDDHPQATLVGSRAAAVEAVTAALSPRSPRSVLLVGEQGVGKTTLVVEALRRLEQPWLAFQAAATEVMAGQIYIGEMEGRVRSIVERMKDRSIVWLFPSFEEALYSGQHSRSPRGLLDAMLPAIEAHDIALIAEIDPTAYELLAQSRPRVTRIFEVIRLAPMTNQETLEVARAWSSDYGVDVDEETLAESLDLATHYLPGTTAPGNLLQLLELVLDRVTRGLATAVTTESVIATLSAATGLPLHVLDPRAPLRLDDVRAFFEGRVLGQPEAVECLVDRVALVKAGLTDPSRPLGVFLFVGPTGTGKTEIAKAFSEFLFGSPDRLVRLDMSEFQTPESLERLLSDAAGGEPAAPLISAVRKQPFTVLLLDEFEKAHENVWDVFLQVFDDGRLTDVNGRTVDLRHCVIILTSNLGSAIPRGPGVGFTGRSGAFDAATVTKSVERSFRPEFLNRLDRVVVFQPLGREIMRGLLEKELNEVLRRRGLRMQPWAVEWDEAAIDFLIEQGFSAELGARPLKRAVERHLLTRIATAIVERQFPEGDQFLFITARDGTGLDVAFVDPNAAEPEPAAADDPVDPGDLTLAAVALEPEGTAAEAAFLRSVLAAVVERAGSWEEAKQDALAAAREQAFWQSEERHQVLSLVEYLDRLGAATATAERLGARLSSASDAHSRELVQLLATRLHVLTAALDGLDSREASDATVTVRPGRSEDADACGLFVQELAAMYVGWADGRGMRVRRNGDGDDGVVVLEVSGLGAYTLLRPEIGLHVLELPHEEDRSFDRVAVLVDVEPAGQGTEGPPHPDRPEPVIVRRYRHEPSPLVRDASGLRTGRIDRVLAGDFDLLADAPPD
jgi:ATP-dependent Clp protease ATP-binding subunit ClpC